MKPALFIPKSNIVEYLEAKLRKRKPREYTEYEAVILTVVKMLQDQKPPKKLYERPPTSV